MADGRMLKKVISKSKKLGALGKDDRARVLYFIMLPHVDVKGRLEADPKIIKGQICTMLPYTERSIQHSLEALHKVGLIILYKVGSDQCLQYTRFDDFQSLNPSREAESKIPEPPENQENSGELQSSPEIVKPDPNEGKTKHLDFVYLTEGEYKKLVDRFGETETKKKIYRLNCYIGSKGRKYKSHYHTILNWSNKDDTQNTGLKAKSDTTKRDFGKQRSEYGEAISV